MPIYRLKNIIQNYAWGSHTDIADLISGDYSSLPQAELWMGAHPKAPSSVYTDFGETLLITDLIKSNPIDVLGEEIFKNFGDDLPYLFKIIAVDKPISIQVHPNKKQAISGFNKENNEQKEISCFERNYKDQNNKFECICALTKLSTLNGFRSIIEMQLLIEMICPDILSNLFKRFKKHPNAGGLEFFLRGLASLSKKQVEMVISQAMFKLKRLDNNYPIFQWIFRLAEMYPNEISIFAPLVLNLFELKPGQAVLIPEGVLHTYMKGMGIEITSNSDNVLRCGLTDKHINIPELLDIIKYISEPVHIINRQTISPCEKLYKTDTKEFFLSVINIANGQDYIASKSRSIEILICTSGSGFLRDKSTNLSMKLKKGDTLLVTASNSYYSIYGNLTLFKAGVPLQYG